MIQCLHISAYLFVIFNLFPFVSIFQQVFRYSNFSFPLWLLLLFCLLLISVEIFHMFLLFTFDSPSFLIHSWSRGSPLSSVSIQLTNFFVSHLRDSSEISFSHFFIFLTPALLLLISRVPLPFTFLSHPPPSLSQLVLADNDARALALG